MNERDMAIVGAMLDAIRISTDGLLAGKASGEPDAIEFRIAEQFSVEVDHVRRTMRAFAIETFGPEAIERDRAETVRRLQEVERIMREKGEVELADKLQKDIPRWDVVSRRFSVGNPGEIEGRQDG